jgi:hypothetical protein
MKNIIITLSILLAACDTHKPLNGVYTYGNTWLIFTGSPAEFKSLSRAHMGFYGYSAGNVVRNQNQVILYGFTPDNLKSLDVESSMIDPADKKGQVHIQYKTESGLIRADLVINGNEIIPVSNDTIVSTTSIIKTVQIKSYLFYKGLLPTPPTIDTLYSPIVKVDEHKNVLLKFAVHSEDFSRKVFNDTLTVSNNHRLLRHNKIKFKKQQH